MMPEKFNFNNEGRQSEDEIHQGADHAEPESLEITSAIFYPENPEKELEKEILQKTVDFRSTEDLKYKFFRELDIGNIFRIGITRGDLRHQIKENSDNLLTARNSIRKTKDEIENSREAERSSETGKNLYVHLGTANEARIGNVFYPEEPLKYVKNYYVPGSEKIEPFGETEDAKETLLRLYSHMVIFAMYHFPEFKQYYEGGLNGPILNDPELYEKFRKKWLDHFWSEMNPPPNQGRECSDFLVENILEGDFALVLSPDTKVFASYHQDYPTEAVLKEFRVKPKQIIGIILTKNPAQYEKPTNEEIFSGSFDKIFTKSNKYYYYNDFLKYLEKNAKNRNIVKKLKKAEGNERLLKDTYENNREKLILLIREFVIENTPFRPNETYMQGLERIASENKIPIYNKNGDMLWPKHMSKDEVQNFVEQKQK